ncbi:MAG: hypothetical protein AMXMBFR64_53790 [Myxococcales bacterium]
MDPTVISALGQEEEPYVGEVEPRRPWVAALLTLLMPGLGHVYLGDARRGLALWASVFVLTVAATAVALRLDLFLAVPLAAWVFFILHLDVWLIIDVVRAARRSGASHVLRPFNHPLVYAGLVVGLGVAPAWLLLAFAEAHLIGSLSVQGQAMAPGLVPGDRVYYDRTAWTGGEPVRGDLVVWEAPGGPEVLRVVGVPGDKVGVRLGAVLIDDRAVQAERLGVVAVTDPALADQSQRLVAWRESLGDETHVVFKDEAALSLDSGDVYVGSDAYFLLADNRTARPTMDSRDVGPVPRRDIVGRPLYVWLSRDPQSGAVRWSRTGLRIQ